MTTKEKTIRRLQLSADYVKHKANEAIHEEERVTVHDLIGMDVVDPLYLDAANDAAKNHTVQVLKCKLTVPLMIRLWKANGRNRQRVWSHVGELAMAMRNDFEGYLTDFALTIDGLNANGGQSSGALFGAFLPLDVFLLLHLHQATVPVSTKEDAPRDKAGNVLTKVVDDIPPFPTSPDVEKALPGQFVELARDTGVDKTETEDGEPVRECETWTEDQILEDCEAYLAYTFEKTPADRWIRITVNVPVDAVRKFDTLARKRQGQEQLELFYPSRYYVESTRGMNAKLLSQTLKALYLRAKVTPQKDDNGVVHYGTPKGGGNTGQDRFPGFFLSHIVGLVDGIEAASNGNGLRRHDNYSSIPLKDIYVVVCATNAEGAKRLGDALRAGRNQALRDLNDAMLKDDSDPMWRRPDASYVQSVLMSVANGTRIDFSKSTPVIHQLSARGKGWDRGDLQDGELYLEALEHGAKTVDKYFDDGESRAEKYKPKRKYSRKRKS